MGSLNVYRWEVNIVREYQSECRPSINRDTVNGCKYSFSVSVLAEFSYLNSINHDFYSATDLWCNRGKISKTWKSVPYFIAPAWKRIFEVMLDEHCSDLMMLTSKTNAYDKWSLFGGGDRGVYTSSCNFKAQNPYAIKWQQTFCNNFNILKNYMIGQREWVWFKPERSSNTSSVWRVILLTWRQNLGYVFTNSDPFSLWNVVIMTLYTQSDKVSKSLTQLSSLLLRGVYKEWDVIMVVNAF